MTTQLARSPALDHLRAAGRELARSAAVGLDSVSDDDLPDLLVAVAGLEAQIAALRLAVLAEADAREVAALAAATGTDAWAARLTGTNRGVMAGGIWLATLLRDKYHATRDAFAAGGINEAQARIIVRAGEDLPEAVSAEQRAAAEAGLVEKAVNGTGPRGLRQAARRMLDVVNRELADRHEADQLDREKQRAERETYLQLWDNEDGTMSGRFTVPELHGQLLRAALERLSAPRRWGRDANGRPVEDPTLPGEGPTLAWTERLGQAFTELLEHLPTEGHAAVAADLIVTIDLEHLQRQVGSARLDTGTTISPGEARRLACGAGIIPAVLGGDSTLLDLGRSRRLHSETQRRALAVRYPTCAAEGCERPFAWSEIHHFVAWSEGGRTDLENGVPLCGWHHRRAHDERYAVTRTAAGEVRFRYRRSVAPRARAA